jgi:heme/copper-type cytochrome/quinol oxidase subunit 1
LFSFCSYFAVLNLIIWFSFSCILELGLSGHMFLNYTNHISISYVYFAVALIHAFVGFTLSLLIRVSLHWPLSYINDGNAYNSVVTYHAIYMIFYFVMPFTLGGLGNLLIPLFINIADMLLPRINNLSLMLLLFSTCFGAYSMFGHSLSFNGGWTLYPPLSLKAFNDTYSLDYLIFALHLAGFSSVLGSINFVLTMCIFWPNTHRNKWPLFFVGNFVVGLLLIISVPVLAVAITLLLFDRNFGSNWFQAAAGGDLLLFQHLFWFFGHPEVYVLILPAFVMVTLAIEHICFRYTIYGYLGMAFAMLAIGFLGCIVWAHHMFTVGFDVDVRFYYSLATFVIALPTGIKAYTWLYSICQSKYTLNTVSLYVILSFIGLFVFGGMTGIILANNAIDILFHDTYFVVAHFHYVLSLGAVFGIFLAFNVIFIEILIPYLIPILPRISFIILLVVAVNGIFFFLHLIGIWGGPRRYHIIPSSFGSFNGVILWSVILLGGIIFSLGFYLIVLSIYHYCYVAESLDLVVYHLHSCFYSSYYLMYLSMSTYLVNLYSRRALRSDLDLHHNLESTVNHNIYLV